MERFAFDKIWFNDHQKGLVWLLNAPIIKIWFRWVMRIRSYDLPLKKTIYQIAPNHFSYDRRLTLADHIVFKNGKRELFDIYNVKHRQWKSRCKIEKHLATIQTTDFRTHSKFSKRLYNAFFPLWLIMHLWDLYADKYQPQLSFGFSTLTVYPDPGTGSTTVNGRVYRAPSPSELWGTIRAGAGNGNATSEASNRILRFDSDSVINLWTGMYRYLATFDTSGLGSGATISAGTASWKGTTTTTVNIGAPGINIYAATPAANNNLQNSDYGQIATTAFSTAILFTNWSTSAYNDFALNASGLAAISKTGITGLGARESVYDVPNSSPTWSSSGIDEIFAFFADTAGTTSDPKLVITYTASINYTLTAAVGTYTLTGIAAAFHVAYHMTAAKGAYVLTGIANIMRYGRVLTAAVGTYTLTGIAAAFQKSLHMTAAVGTYTLTGITVILKRSYILIASGGSYTLTGFVAILRTTFWGSPSKNNANWNSPNKNTNPSWSNPNKNTSNWTFPNKD